MNVFLSVGSTATKEQEEFVVAVENKLKTVGLNPRTIGRNTFSADQPFQQIMELMNDSYGTIVIALERIYFEEGYDKRNGEAQKILRKTKIATPWNQIEATIGYVKKHPILVIVEDGLKEEGLLEKGYDWYVLTVNADKSVLNTSEFNGVLNSYVQKVKAFSESSGKIKKVFNPDEITIFDILKNLRPSQLYGTLIAIISLCGAMIYLGAKFLSDYVN